MNIVKIVSTASLKFSEFYDIRRYAKQAEKQLVVMHYNENKKIKINK